MKIFTLIFVAFICMSAKAQTVEQKWVLRFPGNPNSDLGAMTTDGSGFIYIAATSGNVMFVTKYNSAGARIWLVNYRGSRGQIGRPSDMKVDGSGNVYVTGQIVGPGAEAHFLTLKFNSSGILQWSQIFSNTTDQAYALALDASGSVYVTGLSYVPETSGFSTDYCTVKYSSTGVQQWVRMYNGTYSGAIGTRGGYDEAHDIGIDAAGDVYVGGNSEGQVGKVYDELDFAVVKYNSAGTQIWEARYNYPRSTDEQQFDMAVDAAGNSYLTGYTIVTSLNLLTVKFNSTGTLAWSATYDGPSRLDDYARSIKLDGSGNVLVAGKAVGSGGQNFITIKYSNAGTQLWSTMYDGGTTIDEAFEVKIDLQGAAYVSGYTQPVGPNAGSDFTTVKYSSTGIKQWAVNYTGPVTNGYDKAYRISLYQPSGPVFRPATIYVAGPSQGILVNTNDIALVKYEQPVLVGGAQVIDETPLAGKFSLNSYPNPFRNSTTINYSVPDDSYVSIIVYDGLGREVSRPVSGHRAAGTYNQIFSSDNLSAGIYHYRIIANTGKKNFEQTKMMVLDRSRK